eukprot:6186851-Pleurochrysis_carterae.AAC.3
MAVGHSFISLMTFHARSNDSSTLTIFHIKLRTYEIPQHCSTACSTRRMTARSMLVTKQIATMPCFAKASSVSNYQASTTDRDITPKRFHMKKVEARVTLYESSGLQASPSAMSP